MATLSFTITKGAWSGTVSINYSVSYNAATNKSTVTFSSSSVTYPGRKNYGTDSSTTITIKAGDNQSSTGTASFSTSGTTVAGGKTYSGTPSPSVTVTHSGGTGAKTVSISASTSIGVYPFQDSTNKYYYSGSGSKSHTMTTRYALTISTGTGTTAAVTRTASPVGAATGPLASGSFVHQGDTLVYSYSADVAYQVDAHTVNGQPTSSGYSFTVSSDVSAVTTAHRKYWSLSLQPDGGAYITAERTHGEPDGGAVGPLSDGDTVYYGDVLAIEAGARSDYVFGSCTINGEPMESPYTVVGAVVIVATSTQAGAWLYVDADFASYQIMIFNGTTWDTYIPYVYTGSGWEVY